MQAVVVHPGTTEAALRAAPARRHLPPGKIGKVLLPSPSLSPQERIGVYQGMFPMRMREALAADYPGLEHFLGHHFDEFVTAYTLAHPSRGYTLNRLGDHVPSFLSRQRRFRPRPFLVDLARLELAMTEAFDEKESTTLEVREVERLSPERMERTRLRPVPSVRLVALKWNAGAYLDSLKDEKHNHPKPRRETSYVLVFRRNYSIYRLGVPPAAFALLEDIVAGRTLGESVRRSLARRGVRQASVEDFARWFQQWTAEGVFAGVKRGRI